MTGTLSNENVRRLWEMTAQSSSVNVQPTTQQRSFVQQNVSVANNTPQALSVKPTPAGRAVPKYFTDFSAEARLHAENPHLYEPHRQWHLQRDQFPEEKMWVPDGEGYRYRGEMKGVPSTLSKEDFNKFYRPKEHLRELQQHVDAAREQNPGAYHIIEDADVIMADMMKSCHKILTDVKRLPNSAWSIALQRIISAFQGVVVAHSSLFARPFERLQ